MNIDVSQTITSVVTLAPKGRLDAFNAPEMRTQIQQQVANGQCCLVIDLSETQFLDSAGMAALVSALKLCRQQNGDVRLVWPELEAVKRILALTKFDRVFDIKATAEEAVAAF